MISRYNDIQISLEADMGSGHRTTITLEPGLYRALKLKSASVDKSISTLINEAVRISLAEELEDLETLDDRSDEPSRSFEEFIQEMSDAGEL